MTILSITRLFRISNGLSIPGPVTKKCCVLMATMILFILGSSVVVAVIPLLSLFEDTFVNALYLPDVDFLRGFTHQEKSKTYFGVLLWKNSVGSFRPVVEQS